MIPTTAFLQSIPISLHAWQRQGSLTARRPRHAHKPTVRRVTRVHIVRAAVQQDHYQILDIPEDADAQAVKRAYRRSALKNHPDVSDAPDARQRFICIQEAYTVLSDQSRRATYDRRRRAGAYSPGSSNFPGFDSGFDTSEFTRKWSEANPMPKDIDDSIGNIFSDIFSGVADAVNTGTSASGGVVEDFIDFLEKRVDGFSNSSASRGTRASKVDDDALRSSDEDVLKAEIDDARFVVEQLRQRKRKAEGEEESLNDRARQWRDRADRADRLRDYETRDAARDSETELRTEARRFGGRVDETVVLIRKQEDRLSRFEKRLREVQSSPAKASSQRSASERQALSASQGQNRSTSSRQNSPPKSGKQEEAIDDELQKMKRELGL